MAVRSGRSRSWLAPLSGRLHLDPFASRFLRLPYWFTGKLLPFLVTIVAVFFTAVLAVHLDQDETAITNAAFAAIATLGALSFSAARGVEQPAREAYLTAGEGFLFAALQVISASVIRYGATQLHGVLQGRPQARQVLDIGAGVLIALMFGFAMALVAWSVRLLVAALEMRHLDEQTAWLKNETAALEEAEAAARQEPVE